MRYADAVKQIARGKLAWRPSWPTEYFIKMLSSRRIHDSENRYFPQPKHRADVKAIDWITGESRVTHTVHPPVIVIPPPPPPPPVPVVVVPPPAESITAEVVLKVGGQEVQLEVGEDKVLSIKKEENPAKAEK